MECQRYPAEWRRLSGLFGVYAMEKDDGGLPFPGSPNPASRPRLGFAATRLSNGRTVLDR